MLTITLTDAKQRIDVPQSWEEIRLEDYEKWFCKLPANRMEQVSLLADICRISPTLLLESPVQLFELLAGTLRFIFEENAAAPNNSIELDGQTCCIGAGDELTLAEWVDIEAVFEVGNPSRLSEILAILCRPAGEAYDSKRCENRRVMFASLMMDKAMPLLTFFLLPNKRLATISSLCSQIEEQTKHYLHLTQDFAANGDGIKWWQIWQKIKFFFLTKYLQNRLSKFSDFCSIASTKPVQRN
jgi:hypothetical protein